MIDKNDRQNIKKMIDKISTKMMNKKIIDKMTDKTLTRMIDKASTKMIDKLSSISFPLSEYLTVASSIQVSMV